MYQIKITESAKSDLLQIASFIAAESGSNLEALNYIKKLEQAVLLLKELPERGAVPQYRLLKLQGYRYLVVKSHLIFYRIEYDKNMIIIYRVIHHKQSYKHLL